MAIDNPTIGSLRNEEEPSIAGYLGHLKNLLPLHRVLLLGASWSAIVGAAQRSDTSLACFLALAAVCIVCATYLKSSQIRDTSATGFTITN